MDKNFALNKLVPALRSGSFKKGWGLLRQHLNGEWFYCCLGVACELSETGEWAGDRYNVRGHYSNMSLPTYVQEAIGAHSGLGVLPFKFRVDDDSNEQEWATLSAINDAIVEPFTFDQIADVIQAFYEVL